MNFDEFGRSLPNVLRLPKQQESRSGRCYELAFRTQQRTLEEWVLVHAVLRRDDGTRYDHAWLEIGHDGKEFAFCAVWGCSHAKDYYYGVTRARPKRRYTKGQARRAVDVTGHYGPTWPR